LLNLNLVRLRIHAKNILVLFLAHQRGLLRQRCRLYDVVIVHLRLCDEEVSASGFARSASFARAASVTKIFSNVSNCSVFTSEAVASVTGFTLRADLNVLSSNASETISTFSASVCFLSSATNAFVFNSVTANLSIVRTSPALIRSLSAF